MPYKAIAIDYDGTLVDTLDATFIAVKQFEKSNKVAIVQSKSELKELQDIGLFAALKKLHISIFKLPTYIKLIRKEQQAIPVELLQPYQHIESILAGAQVPVYVITSNISGTVNHHLKHLHLQKYIKKILGADHHPSKVHKLKEVAKLTNCSPTEVIFISDTSHDIKEGNKANTQTVGVLYGYGNEKRMKLAKPNHMVKTPQELQALLMQFKVLNTHAY